MGDVPAARFLAIDPGLSTGWALLDDFGHLVKCLVGNPGPLAVGPVVSTVIEKPRIYPASKSKGSPNDLITLAIQVGRYAERFKVPDTHLIFPRDWKGTVDGDVMVNRILEALNPTEKACVAHYLEPIAPSKRHNAVDAIGLAKWAYAKGLYA